MPALDRVCPWAQTVPPVRSARGVLDLQTLAITPVIEIRELVAMVAASQRSGAVVAAGASAAARVTGAANRERDPCIFLWSLEIKTN